MADECVDDGSGPTGHAQNVKKDAHGPRDSSIVLVISDDDEVEIVEPKLEDTAKVETAAMSDAKPSKCSVAVAEDAKNRKENPGSPRDHTCSICLGEFDNRAFLDQCFHSFCFYCILQWSEVVHTCPLCKSNFSSIIHTIKSMEDYKQHFLPATSVAEAAAATGEAGRRFRYRTTLTGNQQQQRRPRQSAWEMRDQRRQAYQTAQKYRQTVAKEKRRTVYTSCLWVQGVSQQGKPKYRDISPGFFRANPACTHRLVPWLKRELGVLLNDSEGHVHFIQQLVMTLINKVDIDSDEFSRQLRPFLVERTEHFIHEFYSFARSPFDMTAYDERAQYSWPDSTADAGPGSETPTVFHGSSTGWETPAVPEGPSHSRWDRDSPPQRTNSTWSPGPSRGTSSTSSSAVDAETADHHHRRIIQNVHLRVNIETGGVSGGRVNGSRPGSVDGDRSGTKTPSEETSSGEVQVMRTASKSTSRATSQSRTRSRGSSRSRSRSRSLSHSPSQSRESRKRLGSKHKYKKKHKHKRKHRRREKDEKHRDGEKCPDNPAGHVKSGVREHHRKAMNVIVISSDSTASPDKVCGPQVASNSTETLSVGPPRSRASRQEKSRTHSRSNSSSRSSKSHRENSRSRSNFRTKSPTSSRSRTSRHERSRSRSVSNSRSTTSSRSRTSRHRKSRTCSRSNSRSNSRSRKSRHRKTRSHGNSHHGSSRARSRSQSISETRTSPRSRTRSRSNSRSPQRAPSQSERGADSLARSASTTHASSPSVEEIEREIQELEARMREDKKRLLQLMLRQEERAMGGARRLPRDTSGANKRN